MGRIVKWNKIVIQPFNHLAIQTKENSVGQLFVY
jgi:hypothetical protein